MAKNAKIEDVLQAEKEQAVPDAEFVIRQEGADVLLYRAQARPINVYNSIRLESVSLEEYPFDVLVGSLVKALRKGGILYVPAGTNSVHLPRLKKQGKEGAYDVYGKEQ